MCICDTKNINTPSLSLHPTLLLSPTSDYIYNEIPNIAPTSEPGRHVPCATKFNTKHSNVIFPLNTNTHSIFPLNTNTQTLSPSLPLTEYYEATVEFGKSNVECVDINIVDDDDVEEMEVFKIKLLPNAESVKVADDAEKAVVTIVDNDEEIVVIGLQEVEYTASEDNATLTVCVELERGGPGPVTGILEYRDITATALEGIYEMFSR